MGPQVKTRTHSVRQGTPSVPVAALAKGELPHPSFTLHHPSHPLSIHSLMLNHPGMQSILPFPLSSRLSPSVPSLIYPLLSLPFPPTFPPTLPIFDSRHPFLTPLFPSLINHPYMIPEAKLLNYHIFVMTLARTRDIVLIACL